MTSSFGITQPSATGDLNEQYPQAFAQTLVSGRNTLRENVMTGISDPLFENTAADKETQKRKDQTDAGDQVKNIDISDKQSRDRGDECRN